MSICSINLRPPCLSQTMSFLLRRLSQRVFFSSTSSNKISTGICGLQADPQARSNLLKLYGQLRGKLQQLPEDYAYRKGMLAVLENRTKMIQNDAFTDVDLEEEIGEGQLEELVEQAHEELALAEKLSNDWKPWEK